MTTESYDGIIEKVHEGVNAAERMTSAIFDIDVGEFSDSIERRSANRKVFMDWLNANLVKDQDYGKIHMSKNCQAGQRCTNPYHYSKDCLFKPGAEKICSVLGLTPKFPSLDEYEKMVIGGAELIQLLIQCSLVNANGQIVGTGAGARSLKQDYGDINRCLKMCIKSAQIDATIRAGSLNEMFTQDVDVMAKEGGFEPNTAKVTNDAPPPNDPEYIPPKRTEAATPKSSPAFSKVPDELDRDYVWNIGAKHKGTKLRDLDGDYIVNYVLKQFPSSDKPHIVQMAKLCELEMEARKNAPKNQDMLTEEKSQGDDSDSATSLTEKTIDMPLSETLGDKSPKTVMSLFDDTEPVKSMIAQCSAHWKTDQVTTVQLLNGVTEKQFGITVIDKMTVNQCKEIVAKVIIDEITPF